MFKQMIHTNIQLLFISCSSRTDFVNTFVRIAFIENRGLNSTVWVFIFVYK